MYTSGLLPRRVAVLGLIGGSFALVAATGALLGVYDPQSAPQFLLTFPEMIWELTFGISLIVKGFTLAGHAAGRRHAAHDTSCRGARLAHVAPRALPRGPEHRITSDAPPTTR